MNIELKNVKYAAFASEETSCFSAVVYIDGVKSLTAENSGKGGMTFLHEIVKGSYDVLKAEGVRRGEKFEPAEGIVDDLFYKWLSLKEMKRVLKKSVNFIDPARKGIFKFLKLKPDETVLTIVAKKYPNYMILNSLPESKAFELWEANVK